MAIVAVVLYLIVLYVRPGEIIPGWEGIPFAAITQGLGLVAVSVSWLMRPRSFLNQPLDLFVAGYFVAAVLSNPAWGWIGGAQYAFTLLLPAIIAYFLIRGAVRTPKHLRILGYALVTLTLFQAINGIIQYRTGVGLGNVEAYEQRVVVTTDGAEETTAVPRIRGTGIFNDPNDLALAFVAAMPFLVGPLLGKRTTFIVRVTTVLLAVPILIALYLTNSRGGVLGLAAALLPTIWRSGRWLTRVMVVLGLVAALGLAAPSRMTQMDSDESSAQGRVQSWSAGLQMLKMRPVLGVGFGRYGEYNELVAHNSFVHVLGELGMIGGFFFTGMFFWLFRGLASVRPAGSGGLPAEEERLFNWGDELFMACTGLAVSMIFLSRQYVAIVFIFLAMGASYRGLLQDLGVRVKTANGREVGTISAFLVGGIVAVYVAVRVLAVWSAK